MSHDIKDDRRYTKDHEWAKLEGDEVVIGITAYAVDQLGDITLVNVDVGEGDDLEPGKAFGTVESGADHVIDRISDLLPIVDALREESSR